MISITEGKEERSGRIRSLDVLKGAAIIGVVMAHIVLVPNEGEGQYNRSLGELFYAALPMFIVITGYFYRPDRGILENIKRRLVPMIIMFVLLTISLNLIMCGYMMLLGYSIDTGAIMGNIGQMLIGKGCFEDLYGMVFEGEMILGPYEVTYPFYFFQILIVGYLIFIFLVDYVITDWRKTLVAAIALVSCTALYMEFIHLQLPMLAQLGPLVAAFLLIGAFMARYNVVQYIETGYHEKRYWIYFALTLVTALAMAILLPTHMSLIYSEFGAYGGWSAYSFVTTSLSCGILLMFLAVFVSKVRYVSDVLEKIGRDCVWIFLLHMFIAKLLIAPFVTISTDRWFPIDSIPVAIVLVVLTIIVIMILIELNRLALSRIKGSDQQTL